MNFKLWFCLITAFKLSKSDNKGDFLEELKKNLADIDLSNIEIKNEKLKNIHKNIFQNLLVENLETFFFNNTIKVAYLRNDEDKFSPISTLILFQPYLQYVSKSENLLKIFRGIVNITINFMEKDFYNSDASVVENSDNTYTFYSERRFHLENAGSFCKLLFDFYNLTQDSTIFDSNFQRMFPEFINSIKKMQKNLTDSGRYWFSKRIRTSEEGLLHTLGNPVKECGLVRSAFKPSDATTLLPFNIADNILLAEYLHRLSLILISKGINLKSAKEAYNISMKIKKAIEIFGIHSKNNGKEIFAFEVDGFGGVIKTDESSLPSLLSLPFFDLVEKNSEIYRNTREHIFSDENAYFFKGDQGEGIGNSKLLINMISLSSLLMKALTSNDENEIRDCLNFILSHSTYNGEIPRTISKKKGNKEDDKFSKENQALLLSLINMLGREKKEFLKEF